MSVYSFMHLTILLVGTMMLFRFSSKRFKTYRGILCEVIGNFDLITFSLLNLFICLFCFRSRYSAFEDAADVLIFDSQVSLLHRIIPLPILIITSRIMSSSCCTDLYIGITFILIFTFQPFISLLALKIYLKYHQNTLKMIEGYFL